MSTFQTLFSQDIGRMNWRTVLDSFFSAFNQFRTISFIDIIDILIVAYIIYRVMKLLKDTSAERLIKGIIILVGIMLLASMLHLTMISWLLQQALNVGLFAIVVVFQPELRRLLEQIGKGNLSRMLIPDTDPDVVERSPRPFPPARICRAPRPARSSCSSAASVWARSSRRAPWSMPRRPPS